MGILKTFVGFFLVIARFTCNSYMKDLNQPRDHPFVTYTQFFEKLTFLTP